MRWLLIVLALWPSVLFAQAESLVATRLIRANEVISVGDVTFAAPAVTGAAQDPVAVIGLETRVAIYPGRPVRLSDLGPAAVIERNEVVRMVYRSNGLTILSEGRALSRAGLGDQISVMNLASRQTVQATVSASGLVEVHGSPGRN
ncbi:MAG: flagella basal body P-ring formation protein FlgA [Rhodobacteraceae bacterium]|nr:MAG: flagella basal body P-ring formation protein FlgA [Paracoccaceae bacterium]